MRRPLLLIAAVVAGTLQADEIRFNRDIRPILSHNCFGCHGPSDDRKANLRLDTFAGATDPGRKKGPPIIPGDPKRGTFMTRILETDPDEIMPPPDSHKTLTNEEKHLLAAWIRQGATYENHWSLLPIASSSNGDTIDSIVGASFTAKKITPQPQADRRTLIRRVTLDLTGLPPSTDEIRAFLADQRPDAYDRLVDRLLSSPRYGEHMAKYWLDLVRYGDSHGIHADNYREQFAYRDWVIRAFNNNQPFDAFSIDQLAGDLHAEPTRDQLIASGFNRLHISNSAGSALKEELYVNNVTDRVNAVGTVFLGLTVGCAACHDHKYDPISQREYYQLFAYFNNLDGDPDNKGVKSPKPSLPIPSPEQEKQEQALLKAIAASTADAPKLRKKLKTLRASFPTTLIMKERKNLRPAFILNRGEYDNHGEKVTRATPAALPPMATDLPNDRMGLARWLTAPNHPLMARITVNRFWQQLFGVGLVKTAEDFGSQGEWPSHPELLDHLAHTFIDSGWNIKALMRTMVTSDVYKQSSNAGSTAYKADPENRNLARGPRFRMDAEMLRDQALFASGQLVLTMYGRSVKPPQPAGLWKSVSLPGTSKPDRFVPDKGINLRRRSVYTYWKRAYPPPAMTIFNAPNREVCVARRERTNTPLQALVLMNEEQFFGAAKTLANTAQEGQADDADRLAWIYERVIGQELPAMERQLMQQALADYRKMGYDTDHAWTMVVNAIMNLDVTKTKP